MFTPLYFLIVTLALMPQTTHPQRNVHRRRLPYSIRNNRKLSIHYNLEINSTTDMVFVKCPYNRININDTEYDFTFNYLLLERKWHMLSEDSLSVWIPLMKNSIGYTKIKCGRFNVIGNNSLNQVIFYTISLNWANIPKNNNTTHQSGCFNFLPTTCDRGDESVIILYKEKKSGRIVKFYDKNEIDVYSNQKFYYFLNPIVGEKNIFIKPCKIFKIHECCQLLKLLPDLSYHFEKKIKNIYIFNMMKKSLTIHLQPPMRGDIKYNPYEKILLSKMRYYENEVKVVENSTTLITSNFNVDMYSFVQLTYICRGIDGPKNISILYYFRNNISNKRYIKKTVFYDKSNTILKPNCPTSEKNYAYLKAIIYYEVETLVKDLNNTDLTKGKFIKTSDYIFLKSSDNVTKLICIYSAPLDTITIEIKFIEGKKRVFRRDLEGREINRNVVTNPNINGSKKDSKISLDESFKESDRIYESILNFIVINLIAVASILIPLFFLYTFVINPFIKRKDLQKNYTNIYNFWNNFLTEPFTDYFESITDRKFVSDKIKNYKFIKKIEGDDEIDVQKSDIFDESLVNCYKKLSKKIKAHYVYKDSENRKFILCDGITKYTQNSFWQMVYDEDITSIIGIIFSADVEMYGNGRKKLYWPEETDEYEDLTITFLKNLRTKLSYIHEYKFKLERKGGKTKYVIIYHAYNWKEHEIPQSERQFINLYDNIIKNTSHKNFLIHSTEGTGSRVYMLTYFICMYDSMVSNKDIDNPMEVVKTIRDNRYGGNIGVYEFAYVIKALVIIFFEKEIIIELSQRRQKFLSSYDNYFCNFLSHQSKMNDEFRPFLNFVNILDIGKIEEYEVNFTTVGVLSDEELENDSIQLNSAIKQKILKKIRYLDFKCLNSTRVTIRGKPKNEIESFIHANNFEYYTKYNKKRKFILCQAPLEETIDDMLDMIYRHNISTVVILVRPDESPDKWIHYFPKDKEMLVTENYNVLRLNYNEVNKNLISESEYHVISKNKSYRNKVTILHYQGWPDKSVPSEHNNIHMLCKKIIDISFNNYIAIHCSSGVGRTGTLALIIYLIETIDVFPTFDPLERLKVLRQYRYGAVQKFNQFMFALLVVFEHFKWEIDNMNPSAYSEFYDLAHKFFQRHDCPSIKV